MFFFLKLFETFGFRDNFISMVKLLYNEATCMVKIASGLSVSVKVHRGIR